MGLKLEVEGELSKLIFFNWLSNVNNLLLSNGFRQMRSVIQWQQNSFFFGRSINYCSAAEGFAPKTSLFSAVGGSAPRPPSVIRLINSMVYSKRLPIQTFLLFNFWFKPSLFSKILVKWQTQATASDLPFYDIFHPHKVPFSKKFDDVIASDLCFAPSSPIKTPGYICA